MAMTTVIEKPRAQALSFVESPFAAALPRLRVGTRSSPLALWQTRHFMRL